MKDHPRWFTVPMMEEGIERPSKKSKTTSDETPNTTSSDARVRFDLNDEDDEVQIEEPQRPMERDRAKRANQERSTNRDDVMAAVLEYVDRFNLENEKLLSVEQQKLQPAKEKTEAAKMKAGAAIMRAEAAKKRELRKDREFFLSPHTHLSGEQLDFVLKQKEELRRQHGW